MHSIYDISLWPSLTILNDAFSTSDYVASNESKISKKLIKIHAK